MDQEKLNIVIYLHPDNKIKTEHIMEMDLANEIEYMIKHNPKVAIFLNFECVAKGFRNDEDMKGYERMFKYNRHWYEPN